MHRNRTSTKIFLWLPLLLLFIFCIDMFFTVPNADDYDFFLWVKKYGFFGFQKYMYIHQNGRFIAAFFIACYTTIYNAIHIYWIFPLCFFILFYTSFFLFVKVFFRYLKINISALEKISYAAWLSLLFIIVCKQLSSFLFWMPGVINYQLVVSFFIFGITALLNYYLAKRRSILLLSLICFAICSGLHELFFFLTIPGLLFYIIVNIKDQATRNTVLLIVLAILIPFVISYFSPKIFSPGMEARKVQVTTINNAEIFPIIFNAFFRVIFLFGYLLTVPYLYIVLFSVNAIFNRIKPGRLNLFFKKIKVSYLITGLVLQPMLIFIAIFIKLSSGLPERAENLLLIQASFFLLFIAIKLGIEKNNFEQPLNSSFSSIRFFMLLFFLCISSSNMIDGFKGIFSGYAYKKISQSRLANLKINNGTRSLYLPNYQNELDSFYLKRYNKKMPLKLLKVAGQKDILLFSDVYDLLEGQMNSFRHYYDIDTVKTPLRISYSDTLIYLLESKNLSR